jgi:hypothetical protein
MITLQLTKEPMAVDFIKNRPYFTVKAINSVSPSAAMTKIEFATVNSVPRPSQSGEIVLTLPDSTVLTFTSLYGTDYDDMQEADTYVWKGDLPSMQTEFESKLFNHYILSQYYDMIASIGASGLVLWFIDKSLTNTIALDISCTGYSGTAPVVTKYAGVAIDEPENWMLFAKYQLIRNVLNGGTEILKTPEMFFNKNNNDEVEVKTDLLQHYFEFVDIPSMMHLYSAAAMRFNALRVKLLYAQAGGSPLAVKWVQQSNEFHLLNARLQSQYYDEGKLDITLPSSQSDIIADITDKVIAWGMHSGERVRTFEGMEQYVYLSTYYCTGNHNIVAGITYITATGTTGSIAKPAVNLGKNNIYRFLTDMESLGIDGMDVIEYTVNLTDNAVSVFSRIYTVIPKPYFAKVFILQNKYGLLESFFVDNLLKEKTLEGSEVVLAEAHHIDIEKKDVVYTARTGSKRIKELPCFEHAAANKFNYIIADGRLVPIVILPDSFTIADEEKDLQGFEFKFKVSNEAEELPVTKETYEDSVPDIGYVADAIMLVDGIINTRLGHNDEAVWWEDLTGNENHVNLVTGALASIEEDAVYFNPSDEVNLPITSGPVKENGEVVDSFEALTIEICFKMSADQPAGMNVIAQIYESVAGVRYDFASDDNAATVTGKVYDNDEYKLFLEKHPILTKELYTVSLVISGGTTYGYVNAVLIESHSGITEDIQALLTEGVSLGNYVIGECGFKGRIHNFRIYKGALTEEQIIANHNNDVSRFGDDSGSGSASGSASGSGSGSASASASASESGGGLPPVAEFDGNPRQGSKPLSVQFTDMSMNDPDGWFWDFGDGTPASTEQNPVHDYKNPGIFTVSLEASNAYGQDTEVKIEYIEVI